MDKDKLHKKWWLMTDRIAEITYVENTKYSSCNAVWHWFETRKCGRMTQKQFETYLINNFDGLQVIRLLELYEEYEDWPKNG